ncbi:MAG: cytochrome c4 [Burkholderiaceae bacterium]|jgi:cytochrome c553|nr:cytochrome c4 [Burkholderiaceae bacterium]
MAHHQNSRPQRLARWVALGVLVAAAGLAHAQGNNVASVIARNQCAVCHGEQGESTNAQFPQLAGQNAQYLRKQLEDFRAGTRKYDAMNAIARELTDAQIQALGAYYEVQKPAQHPSDDALLVGVGRYIYERGNIYTKVPACVSCHSASGQGSARLPRLAGQHPQYVENQLRRFHAKERRNDSGAMAFVTEGLSELELRAVAAYVGGMGASAANPRGRP